MIQYFLKDIICIKTNCKCKYTMGCFLKQSFKFYLKLIVEWGSYLVSQIILLTKELHGLNILGTFLD